MSSIDPGVLAANAAFRQILEAHASGASDILSAYEAATISTDGGAPALTGHPVVSNEDQASIFEQAGLLSGGTSLEIARARDAFNKAAIKLPDGVQLCPVFTGDVRAPGAMTRVNSMWCIKPVMLATAQVTRDKLVSVAKFVANKSKEAAAITAMMEGDAFVSKHGGAAHYDTVKLVAMTVEAGLKFLQKCSDDVAGQVGVQMSALTIEGMRQTKRSLERLNNEVEILRREGIDHPVANAMANLRDGVPGLAASTALLAHAVDSTEEAIASEVDSAMAG